MKRQSSKELNLLFLPLVLQEALLPRRLGPTEATRAYGNTHITLSGGIHRGKRMKLPAAVVARRLFYWLVTEAKRTGSPIVKISGSTTLFKTLGLTETGGQLKRLRMDLLRLSRMSITIERFNAGTELALPNISVFKTVCLEGVGPDGQMSLFDHYLEFADDFFQAILSLKHQPINNDALSELKTALAIDIYLWAARRTQTILTKKEFSWKQLQAQFGSPNEQPSKFRKAFKTAFDDVSGVLQTWGGKAGHITGDGVVLLNGPQQVSPLEIESPVRW